MDEEGHPLLLNFKADAGHNYYIRYHAVFLKDAPAWPSSRKTLQGAMPVWLKP
jgi:hypothetical protein